MKTMKAIEEAAAKLRHKYALNAGADLTAVLTTNIGKEFDQFQAKLSEGLSDEEIPAALSPVKSACLLYNDLKRNERLDQLKAMSLEAAVEDYLRSQSVVGYAIKREKNDDAAAYSLDPAAVVEVSAYDMVEALYPTGKGAIIDACCIFADNLARFHFKGNEKAAVSRKALSSTYAAMRKRRGWDVPIAKLSKSVLAGQLSEIVKLMCYGQDIRMINADVSYLLSAVLNGKTTANDAGSFVMRNERTIVEFIFRAAYTRKNSLPYKFQNGTRGADSPVSEKANKAMAEADPEKDAMPEVTAEHVDIPGSAADEIDEENEAA